MTAQTGAILGWGPQGVAAWPAFAAWLGRSPTVAMDYGDNTAWANLQSSASVCIPAWAGLIKQLAAATPPVTLTFEYSVPLPNGATLAECATGAYAAEYAALGALFVANGITSPILRPLWEFNLSTQPWFMGASLAEYDTWIKAFQQIVIALRGVPGLTPLIHWCAAGWDPLPTAVWPGAAWVDIIGQDLYDKTYQGPTPAARWAVYAQWLGSMAAFGLSQGKPLALGEWGVGGPPACAQGGGDNPLFVANVAAWVAGNNVHHASSWQRDDAFSGFLPPPPQPFPLSAAAFLKAFSPQSLAVS